MLRTTMHWRIRYLRVNGSMLPTLVRNFLVHKGSQWVMYNATVVYVYEYEGTPCVQQIFIQLESGVRLINKKYLRSL